MASCSVCDDSVNGQKISCRKCEKVFHGKCVKLNKGEMDLLVKTKNIMWNCSDCENVRGTDKSKVTLEDIYRQLKELTMEQKDLGLSLEVCHGKLDDTQGVVKEQKEAISSLLQTIEILRTQNNSLKREVVELKDRVDDLEQYSRMNSIEIQGVPETVGEAAEEVVGRVIEATGLRFDPSMIDTCHRLPSNTAGSTVAPPRGIIVKFVRRVDKEKVLQARQRTGKVINTLDLGWTMNNPVYINECLSPNRKRLFAMVRARRKTANFQFAWTKRGKIFVKRRPGEPAIHIKNIEDIEKIK